MAEWMALVTLVLGVQWSEVWSLPLWLWRQHVELCRAHLARAKEANRHV